MKNLVDPRDIHSFEITSDGRRVHSVDCPGCPAQYQRIHKAQNGGETDHDREFAYGACHICGEPLPESLECERGCANA